MNGYELKTGFFSKDEDMSEEEKMGLSKRSNNNRSFKEIDQIILNTIAEHMNFTYRRMFPKDDKFFGYQLPNGTYVGAIGINVTIFLWNYLLVKFLLFLSVPFFFRLSYDNK